MEYKLNEKCVARLAAMAGLDKLGFTPTMLGEDPVWVRDRRVWNPNKSFDDLLVAAAYLDEIDVGWRLSGWNGYSVELTYPCGAVIRRPVTENLNFVVGFSLAQVTRYRCKGCRRDTMCDRMAAKIKKDRTS